jgi:hypothetical protein
VVIRRLREALRYRLGNAYHARRWRRELRRHRRGRGGDVTELLARPPLVYDGEAGGYPERRG